MMTPIAFLSIAAAFTVAEPRVATVIPCADDDRGVVNTRAWALEGDESHLALMNPARVQYLVRRGQTLVPAPKQPVVEGRLVSAGDLEANLFGVMERGTHLTLFAASPRDDESPRRVASLRVSRLFRDLNLRDAVVVKRDAGSTILFPDFAKRRILVAERSPDSVGLRSDGGEWDGDRELPALSIPGLTCVAVVPGREAALVARAETKTGPAGIAVWDWRDGGLKERFALTERTSMREPGKGLLMIRSIGATKDGKLVLCGGSPWASIFLFTPARELDYRGCVSSQDDDKAGALGAPVKDLVEPSMVAAGSDANQLACVDQQCRVSLCRYDPVTSKMSVDHRIDLHKLLGSNPGTPLAVAFAGNYLRLATSNFELIEIEP